MRMESHRRLHRRWHRRHDFRLQRRLFWWFGFTTFMTCLVSFGVMRLVSPDVHGWRKDAERVEQLVSGQFARVWDDEAARRRENVAADIALAARFMRLARQD